MTDSILNINLLEKSFGGNKAVDEASFAIERGKITGLIGPNGAGKTTCFNCIAGNIVPDNGSITFNGDDITELPPHKIFKLGISRTFQIPQELTMLTVQENLMLAPKNQIGERFYNNWFLGKRIGKQETNLQKRAIEVLTTVGLADKALDLAGTLSGGQRKLLELGRALMQEPELVLLDEPNAGVNPKLANQLVAKIKELNQILKITFLIIGHDIDVVSNLSDKLVFMSAGKVLLEGSPDEVLRSPIVQDAYLGSQYRE
jgi:branched-chain amino acid transport system ATP-binding protein